MAARLKIDGAIEMSIIIIIITEQSLYPSVFYSQDLSSIPHQQRESLWKAILEIKSGLQLNHTPTMNRGNSSASTTSIHSSGGSMVGNQVYRATRFTLKQTLSFKVEKEDD